MKLILACALAIFLAGCAAIDPADFDSPEAYQAAVATQQERFERYKQFGEVMRLVAVSQLEEMNRAGVDPFQMEERKLLRFSAFCNTATAIATVINPEMATLSSEGTEFCSLVTKALAEAPAS